MRIFLNKNKQRGRGFTLVELLIVVVVIAILAAIVVVGYRGVVGSAREASLRSDLKNAISELSQYNLANRTYPADGSSLKSSNGNVFTYQSDGSTYCLAAYSESNPGMVFRVTQEEKIESGKCGAVTTVIATGNLATCSVASAKAYCWGHAMWGKLGTISGADSKIPVAVDTTGVLAGKEVTAIAIGPNHSCAIATGKVYCWGKNLSGQLGDTTTTQRMTPVAVDTAGALAGKTATAVTVGEDYTCTLASGAVYCWGKNQYGQLGNNSTAADAKAPVAVDTTGVLSGKTVTAIGGGAYRTCAVASGKAYCWGWNDYGALGNGSAVASSNIPVAADIPGKTVTAITAGTWHTCAIASGQAYCWGSAGSGRLGNGDSMASSSTPVPVSTAGALAGKTVTAISSGSSHTCAIASGQAYCWGSASSGQLGNNSTSDSNVPVAVSVAGVLAGKSVTAIAGGSSHSCAIATGKVYCWGLNNYGGLGNDSTASSPTPVQAVDYPL